MQKKYLGKTSHHISIDGFWVLGGEKPSILLDSIKYIEYAK